MIGRMPIVFTTIRITNQTDCPRLYIEVVTDKYAAAPLAEKTHENLATLYQ